MSNFRLRIEGVTKQFPGVIALDHVDLEVKKGEVLSIIGENGAGKSTLMKILSGALQADAGEIYLDDELITDDKNPRQRMNMGIAIVYQELNYLDDMSIAENLYMSELPVKGFIKRVDFKKLEKDTKELLEKFSLHYSPSTLVGQLTIAEKQMIEILRAVSHDVKVLVLDEPTSALSEIEIEKLYIFIRELTKKGVSILYISHKLDEVFEISDKVQIMRDGKKVGYLDIKDTNQDQLVELMVGRSIVDMYPKKEIKLGETVLRVEKLNCEMAKDISFEVKKGEILGLFGLLGSGRTETVEGLIGKKARTIGKLEIDGKEVFVNNPLDAKKFGIAYVPSDRKKEGLVLANTVSNNITATCIDDLRKGIVIDSKKEKELVEEWIRKLSIKTLSPNVQVDSLSGGNQQKVVIAKWLLKNPKVLILNEPTRGIDVGAKVEIYKLMEELASKGIAVIMVSSELPETIGIADRILIFRDGEIKGEVKRNEFTQKGILSIAVGGK